MYTDVSDAIWVKAASSLVGSKADPPPPPDAGADAGGVVAVPLQPVAMIEAAAMAARTVARFCMYDSSYGCRVPLDRFMTTLPTA